MPDTPQDLAAEYGRLLRSLEFFSTEDRRAKRVADLIEARRPSESVELVRAICLIAVLLDLSPQKTLFSLGAFGLCDDEKLLKIGSSFVKYGDVCVMASQLNANLLAYNTGWASLAAEGGVLPVVQVAQVIAEAANHEHEAVKIELAAALSEVERLKEANLTLGLMLNAEKTLFRQVQEALAQCTKERDIALKSACIDDELRPNSKPAFLALIGGMAQCFNANIHGRLDVVYLKKQIEQQGIEVSDKFIRTTLKAAAEYVPVKPAKRMA